MHVYRISFVNQGKIYVVYAERVGQGDLYGFVEVSGLLFGEQSSVVIDPSEEKLKSELGGVTRLIVPIHTVIRIYEVEKRGANKILEVETGSNVTPFPVYTPGRSGDR
jgi:hypothetical protein